MAVLKTKQLQTFNVKDKAHLAAYSVYFNTGSWGAGGCPFALEEDFTNIPDMCANIIITEYLKGK